MADPPPLTSDEATSWFAAAVPDEWFSEVRVLVDRDEIMVIGNLVGHDETAEGAPDQPDAATTDDAAMRAIETFREHTRDARIAIAQKAEARFERKVSWAAGCGDTQAAFTHLSVPVMTRLRLPERRLLDTLVGAGVARSRSDALGWCVRLVAEHEAEWLEELRSAIATVDEIRSRGPRRA